MKHRICDAVIDHQFLFPLTLAVRTVDGIHGLLHFRVDTFLEVVGTLFQPRLDHAPVLFDGQRRVPVEVIDDPALTLGYGIRAKLLTREFIAPIAKATLGKFLDIALVHQRHALAPVRKSILDSPAYQPLRPRWRNGFNSYTRIPTNLFLPALQHLAIQEFKQLLGFRRTGFPLDSDVHVFRILTKDHDVHLFGMCNRGGNSLVVTHRAFARI